MVKDISTTMRAPEEILLQILRDVADILPFDEILQARLVNRMLILFRISEY